MSACEGEHTGRWMSTREAGGAAVSSDGEEEVVPLLPPRLRTEAGAAASGVGAGASSPGSVVAPGALAAARTGSGARGRAPAHDADETIVLGVEPSGVKRHVEEEGEGSGGEAREPGAKRLRPTMPHAPQPGAAAAAAARPDASARGLVDGIGQAVPRGEALAYASAAWGGGVDDAAVRAAAACARLRATAISLGATLVDPPTTLPPRTNVFDVPRQARSRGGGGGGGRSGRGGGGGFIILSDGDMSYDSDYDGNADLCDVCHKLADDTHDLICCDGCPRSRHPACAGLPGVPSDERWFCGRCSEPLPDNLAYVPCDDVAMSDVSNLVDDSEVRAPACACVGRTR